MATWHFVLYAAAAILALRSFVQLVTNYRSEFEHTMVKDHLTRMAEEIESGSKTKKSEAAESVSEKQSVAG